MLEDCHTSNKKGNFEVQLTAKIESPRIQVINRMMFKRIRIIALSDFDLILDSLDLSNNRAFNNRNLNIPTLVILTFE